MHTRNDIIVPAADIAAALRRILPARAGRSGHAGPHDRIAIAPAGEGMARLTAQGGSEDVPASGEWVDAVEVPAAALARLVARKRAVPGATVRLVFHGGMVAMDETTVSATLAPAQDAATARPAGAPCVSDLPLFAYRAAAERRPPEPRPTGAPPDDSAARAERLALAILTSADASAITRAAAQRTLDSVKALRAVQAAKAKLARREGREP
jgi:hypothetical protein